MNQLKEHLQQLSPTPLQEGLESFDHIELTDEEIELALRQAREQKHYLLKRQEYNAKLNEDLKPPKFTAEQMIEAYAEEFIVDDDNREVVAQLAYYFATDPRFTGSFNRGLFLYGPVGVGKTELMRFFQRNQKQSFRLYTCRAVETGYAKKGDEGIGAFYTQQTMNAADIFGHRQIGYCFDDLGTEPVTTNFYGTAKAVMAEVILNRYDAKIPFVMTHVTSNLTAEQIRHRYGDRAADRMREMFNFIAFTGGKSRRA